MKKMIKILGVIAVVAVMVSVSGCQTISSVGGTVDRQGLISQASSVARHGTEIASYNVYLGLFTQHYAEYVTDVRAALAAGKEVSSITTTYFVFTTTKAYARNKE